MNIRRCHNLAQPMVCEPIVWWMTSNWPFQDGGRVYVLGTVEWGIYTNLWWKKSWPPYRRVVPNRSAQNWPLQRALSEWRISKGTTDGHFRPPWSFALILSMMTAPPCGHRMITQKGTSRNSCLVPYTLQPFKALTPEGKPFEGIRA